MLKVTEKKTTKVVLTHPYKYHTNNVPIILVLIN